MTITCDTEDTFLDTLAGLVRRGLMFQADAGALTIKLTGGY